MAKWLKPLCMGVGVWVWVWDCFSMHQYVIKGQKVKVWNLLSFFGTFAGLLIFSGIRLIWIVEILHSCSLQYEVVHEGRSSWTEKISREIIIYVGGYLLWFDLQWLFLEFDLTWKQTLFKIQERTMCMCTVWSVYETYMNNN